MLETAKAYFYKHVLKMRHPAEMAWVLVYPAIGIISIGIFAIFLSSEGQSNFNPLFFVAAGALVWDVYGLVQRAIVYSTTFDVWDGCIRHGYLYRSRFRSFLLGNTAFGIISAAGAALIVIAVAYFAFGFNIFDAGLYLVASLLSTTLFAVGIGLMIIAMMLRRNYSYMSLAWMITGVIMIFSGVYYPVDILPEPFSSIGNAIPATHSISALRGALGLEGVDIMSELIYAFVSSSALLAIAMWFYSDSVKVARKKGYLLYEF
jgi:ABC-2 type transport system permease protein